MESASKNINHCSYCMKRPVRSPRDEHIAWKKKKKIASLKIRRKIRLYKIGYLRKTRTWKEPAKTQQLLLISRQGSSRPGRYACSL
jgi:hypothetical protein